MNMTQINGWIDVTDAPYNADPTGTVDSTMQIAMAINAIPARGAVLYFPPGTYNIYTRYGHQIQRSDDEFKCYSVGEI
jgi:hypothetical protein